jgi:hypothetical protein
MQCLLSKSLVYLLEVQPRHEQEHIFTQSALNLSFCKLDMPTMAKFHFTESVDVIWMAWNLFLRKFMDDEWDTEAIVAALHANTNCREGQVVCTEVVEDFSESLLLRHVEELLEGYFRGPAIKVKRCTAAMGGHNKC